MFDLFKNLLNNSNPELKEILSKPDVFLVDVRTTSEYATGSATNAINIPLDKITDQISKFNNKKNIVLFCRSGNRSGMAKNILEQNGIINITNGGSLQNVLKHLEL